MSNERFRTAELCAQALADLPDQLEAIGIYIHGEDCGQWAGTEGLYLTEAERAVEAYKNASERVRDALALPAPPTADGVIPPSPASFDGLQLSLR